MIESASVRFLPLVLLGQQIVPVKMRETYSLDVRWKTSSESSLVLGQVQVGLIELLLNVMQKPQQCLTAKSSLSLYHESRARTLPGS